MDSLRWKQCASVSYDILTTSVSVLDLITDVLVMIQFYNKGRIVFFIASLTILVIAQLSCVLSFWGRHHRRNSPLLSVSLFFIIIPFAPCLSFIFYIVADESRYKLLIENTCCLSQLICNNPYTTYVDDDKSELQQWMQEKLYKHIGFICQSLFESFPQSILQLIAIIYYNDTVHMLSIFSILLSVFSVCSKSFAFSISVSINIKSVIFSFLCCATDFISIFFTVSIIFYSLNHPDHSAAFYSIQLIYCWKITICVIPAVLIGSIGINLYCSIHYINYSINNHHSLWHIIAYCVTITLFIQLIWIVLLCLCIMSCEVFCLIWFVLLFTEIGLNNRLSNSSNIAQQFYMRLIQWIKDAGAVHITPYKLYLNTSSHQKIRAFAINKVLLISATQISSLKTQWHRNSKDDKLLRWIFHKQNDELCNIHKNLTWIDFRRNTDDPSASLFCRKFWRKYYGKLWIKYKEEEHIRTKHMIGFIVSTLMTFVLCPIYFASRILNILFPAFVVLYLYFVFDIKFWYDEIDPFQVTTCIIYVIFLVLSFCVLLCSGILHEQYFGWHILPISQALHTPKDYEMTNLKFMEIKEYYDNIVYVPIITRLVNGRFGSDICDIIMDYYHQVIVMKCEDSYHTYDEYNGNESYTIYNYGEYDEDDTDDEVEEETNSLLPITRINS